MTKEDISRMALEAGLVWDQWSARFRIARNDVSADEVFECFAAAIRSATKKECAMICDELEMRNTRAGPADCGAAIRASK